MYRHALRAIDLVLDRRMGAHGLPLMGTGDGSGALAMFGTPGGGGIGPKGPVFGNGGNARLITFVCDASGSMINKMASLKDQLNKAVVGLRPIQSANTITWFSLRSGMASMGVLIAA